MSTIEAFKHLTDAELLRERGLFVAEGRLVVRRVIEDPRYRLHSLLLNEAAKNDLAGVLAAVPRDVPIDVQPSSAFQAITGVNFHRGCLALVHRPAPLPTDTILRLAARALEKPPRILLLENVTNADNLGGVFRNAVAFGAGGVILSPACCDPLYRKAVRTSMGAVLSVPFARADDWPHTIVRARENGFVVVALTPRQPSESIDTFAAQSRLLKVALMIGTEGSGMSDATEAAADVRVRIPMADGVDSLNLAVAAGIALHSLAVTE